MANRGIEGTRFVLNTWHILPQQKNELSVIIRFLENNPKINVELNSFTPESTGSDTNKISVENLTAPEALQIIISAGIQPSRVICDHLAESKLPMFRFVKR